MERSRSLVTFAFVRDAMQSGDIVAGLVPLFAPVINRRKGQVFDPQVFSRDLDELCGFQNLLSTNQMDARNGLYSLEEIRFEAAGAI